VEEMMGFFHVEWMYATDRIVAH